MGGARSPARSLVSKAYRLPASIHCVSPLPLPSPILVANRDAAPHGDILARERWNLPSAGGCLWICGIGDQIRYVPSSHGYCQ